MRSLAVPSGTVGGRMGVTRIPFASSCWLQSRAVLLLPAMIGCMGVAESVSSKSICCTAVLKVLINACKRSLRQLSPAEIESETVIHGPEWKLPCVEIEDSPKYSWRGFMLDEARHFQGIKTVKKILDQMALLKLNRFHWHLTDDQGWRIEIKQYPRLTQIGGKRAGTVVSNPYLSKKHNQLPHFQ